jgi:hypothetical protein
LARTPGTCWFGRCCSPCRASSERRIQSVPRKARADLHRLDSPDHAAGHDMPKIIYRSWTCGNEPPWGVEPQTYALREIRSSHPWCSPSPSAHVARITAHTGSLRGTPFRATDRATTKIRNRGRGSGQARWTPETSSGKTQRRHLSRRPPPGQGSARLRSGPTADVHCKGRHGCGDEPAADARGRAGRVRPASNRPRAHRCRPRAGGPRRRGRRSWRRRNT